jgi:Leucine-rich repeat (LRR) protein
VKILCLDKCDGFSDVSCLKDVYNLSLARCVNVKDVAMLAGCHRVNISSCNNIEDISSLSHVPYLNIEDMVGVMKGLSADYSVKELRLNGIMLKHIPFLRFDCHIILRSELSKPFVELAILQGLYRLQKISYTGSIPLVNNWKLYSQLTKLFLNRANLSNTAISDLPNLKCLEIKYCYQSSFDIDFSTLPALTDLYLEKVNLNSFIMSRNNTKLRSVIIDYVTIQDKAIHLYQSLEKLEISRVRGQKVKLVLHCEIEKAQGVTVMNIVCDDHLETITVSDFSQLLH